MSAGFWVFLAALLAMLLIVEPVLGRRIVGRLERAVAGGVTDARLRFYRFNIVTQWVTTAIVLAAWIALGRTTSEIGLHASVSGLQWIWIAVFLALTATVALSVLRARHDPDTLDGVRGQGGGTLALAPHTAAELQRFDVVSITAGICEEIVYRGVLLTALASLVGPWLAVLLSSIVFGIGHAYHGAGAIRVVVVGLVFGLSVVLTGSLLVAMLMHAVLDLVQGRLLYAAVNERRPEPNASAA